MANSSCHNIPHTVPDEATGALGSLGSHLTTCTQSHKGMRWFVQGHHTNHPQGQQWDPSSSAPGSGSWTMMPLTALQQSAPHAINPSSRSTLNHSRIMTFLWEDNTSLQTWELGRRAGKSPKAAEKNLRSYTGKQLYVKTKSANCCLLLAISYPFSHLFSTIFSSFRETKVTACAPCPMAKRNSGYFTRGLEAEFEQAMGFFLNDK